MKKSIVLLFIAFSQICFAATDTLNVSSKITDVTVFFSGAQITREVKLNLTKGKHTLFLDKLPQEVNPESIQVKGLDGLQILSVKHQFNFQNKSIKKNDEKDLEKKIDALKLEVDKIRSSIQVFDLEKKLILDNSMMSKENSGTTVSTIKEAADFYRSRLNEINLKKIELNEKAKGINEKMKEVYIEINKVQSENSKTFSQIYISIDCQQAINRTLNLTYLISSAAWEPTYDFRVDEVDKPLNLVYNAKVYQSSGEDWNGVNITLSSNNPSLSGEITKLKRWYVGRENTYNQTTSKSEISAISGNIRDVTNGEPMPFANIVLENNGTQIAGVNADFDGNFTIKPIPAGTYTIIISYVGYDTHQEFIKLPANKTIYQDFALNPGISIGEVQVISYKEPLIDLENASSGYNQSQERTTAVRSKSVGGIYSRDSDYNDLNIRGSRSSSSDTYIDGVKMIGTEVKTLIANSINTTNNIKYTILIPYTIQSDGEDNNIKIKEVDMKVDYLYKTVPKIETDVFLTANITEWSKLNLLSGNSSIYFQGTFVGESFLDVKETSDTLSISLGRDQNIIVKREENKEIYDKRLFTNAVKETQGIDITVRNSKKQSTRIMIEDQYPLSNRKNIDTELLEKSGAKVEEKEGKLTWIIDLAPEETKKLTFSYSVKYPQ
jgi:hypothetical protein